jgi:hypothetical protein
MVPLLRGENKTTFQAGLTTESGATAGPSTR